MIDELKHLVLDCDDDASVVQEAAGSYTEMQNLANLINWAKVMMVTVSSIRHTLKQNL